MIFLLDENFPKAAIEVLTSMGHTVHDFREIGIAGSNDSEVILKAQSLSAVLLTTDRDFFHTIRHQYPEHAGVVVIALKQPSRAAILGRLQWFLRNVPEKELAGRAFQFRDKTWVVQPPLSNAKRQGEPGG